MNFNLFKKKPAAETVAAAGEAPAGTAAAEQAPASTGAEDTVTIHVMPARFRSEHVKVSQAKTAGMIIIIGGVVVMLGASALFYYFLFRQPAVKPTVDLPITATTTDSAPNKPAAQKPEDNQTATTIATSSLATDSQVASSTATTTPETGNQIAFTTMAKGPDSDNDGLTDKEEELLGADKLKIDSDGDSYGDSSEVLNLYNPVGTNKLINNPGIASYENNTFGYSLLYLKSWSVSANGGDDSIMFKSDDNHFIQVIVQPNPNKTAIEDWFKLQFAVAEVNSADAISAATWSGVKNSDGLTVYLTDSKNKYIYTITYNPAASDVLNYNTIFQAMVKSFEIVE